MGIENITVKKRLLLHLLDWINYQDYFEAPKEATQKGIATAINIHRSAAARELINCVEEGLVFSKMSNIKGGKRRKKVYFLTPKGYEISQELKNEILNIEVRYREEVGEEYKIAKFSKLLGKHPKFSLVQLLNNIEKDRIELFKIERKGEEEKKEEKLQLPIEIPEIRQFVGRKKELNEINNILENDKSSIIVITGIAGIGKTTLASKLVSEKSRLVFWYEIGEWTSLHHLIKDIAEFLSNTGKDKLKKYITRNFDLREILEILKNEVDNSYFIFVFDDFHHANKDIEKFFFYFIRIMEKIKNFHVLITSRDLPNFYDRRYVHIKRNIFEFKLEGINKEDIAYMLKLNKEKIDEIYRITNGHPLALELIVNLEKYEAFTDFQTFLEEEIFKRLKEEEKEILGMASIYRYPVNSDGILSVKIGNYNTLLSLVNKNFIKRQGNNFYLHSMIKEFFYSHLEPQKRKNFHLLASEYYKSELMRYDDFTLIFERLYHLINAEKYEESASLILEYDDEFIENADSELLNLLEKLDMNAVLIEQREEILEIKGDASAILGEYEQALEIYKKNLDIIEEDSLKSAEVLSKIADVSVWKGEIDKSISYHLKSLKIFRKKKRKKEMAKIYNDLGLDFTRKGEMSKALEYFKNALNCLDEDEVMKYLVYLNIGNLFALNNDFKNAIEYYNKPLKNKTSSKKDFYKLQISSYVALAEIEKKKNNLANIEEYLKKGIEIAIINRDGKEGLKLAHELIDFYLGNENYAQAGKFITEKVKQIEVFLKLENPIEKIFDFRHRKKIGKINELNLSYGEICEKASEIFEKLQNLEYANIYYERSAKIFKEVFMDKKVGKIYLKIALNCSKLNKIGEAEKYFFKSIEKLNQVKEFEGLAIAHLCLGNFYKEVGRIMDAKKQYELSRDYAINAGYVKAEEKALELLKNI